MRVFWNTGTQVLPRTSRIRVVQIRKKKQEIDRFHPAEKRGHKDYATVPGCFIQLPREHERGIASILCFYLHFVRQREERSNRGKGQVQRCLLPRTLREKSARIIVSLTRAWQHEWRMRDSRATTAIQRSFSFHIRVLSFSARSSRRPRDDTFRHDPHSLPCNTRLYRRYTYVYALRVHVYTFIYVYTRFSRNGRSNGADFHRVSTSLSFNKGTLKRNTSGASFQL